MPPSVIRLCLSYDSAIIIAPAAGGSAKRGKLPSITKMALW
jgi:hypothetical protein